MFSTLFNRTAWRIVARKGAGVLIFATIIIPAAIHGIGMLDRKRRTVYTLMRQRESVVTG